MAARGGADSGFLLSAIATLQFVLMNPCRYHNEFVGSSQLADDHDLTSIYDTPADQVPLFSGTTCLISLTQRATDQMLTPFRCDFL